MLCAAAAVDAWHVQANFAWRCPSLLDTTKAFQMERVALHDREAAVSAPVMLAHMLFVLLRICCSLACVRSVTHPSSMLLR
jgi:hypothetical protein